MLSNFHPLSVISVLRRANGSERSTLRLVPTNETEDPTVCGLMPPGVCAKIDKLLVGHSYFQSDLLQGCHSNLASLQVRSDSATKKLKVDKDDTAR
uniref:Uncharacterized protein n=1 Tax=Angiostrongylus cantonensis TaxID=6313 RepID=A0A0K0DRE6_ANGCA